jgi:hypothetical protein
MKPRPGVFAGGIQEAVATGGEFSLTGAERAGGDTNAANDRVAEAKRELVRQFDRARGNPY